MARSPSSTRLAELVEAGARVFTEKGYRRTLMGDVARAAGVSAGSLYTYVEGKEALFHLLFDNESLANRALPVPTPAPGETLDLVRKRLASAGTLSRLGAALRSIEVEDVRSELAAIIEERYAFQARNWRLFALIERSAVDLPELKDLYFTQGRRKVNSSMARYLDRRMSGGHMRKLGDPVLAARIIEEAITWFSWHRRDDPDTAKIDDSRAIASLVETFSAALVP